MKIFISLLVLFGFQSAFSQTTTRAAKKTETTVTSQSSAPVVTTPAVNSTTTTTESTVSAQPPVVTVPSATAQTVQTKRSETTVAAPNEVVVDDKEILLLEEKQARAVKRGSSEFNRMDKNYVVQTQVFGQGPVNGTGVGLGIGQFIDRNRLGLVEWMRNDSARDDLRSTEELNNFSIGAHFKKYERDFYYWRMGADYRYSHYEVNGASGGEFNSDALNVTLAAGVQWYFESFTAGVDAVGVSVPLFTNIRNEKVFGNFSRASLDDEQKKYVTDTTYILGRVYLGVAF